MTEIKLTTKIKAPIERCFDLSRSIDLHVITASNSKEKAISGTTTGLIEKDQYVEWKAKHFGIWLKMTVKITEFEKTKYFVDEQMKGQFKFMRHVHSFKSILENNQDHTLMIDTFEFKSPYWIIGSFVDKYILKQYFTNFIKERNNIIKLYAETDKWKEVLL